MAQIQQTTLDRTLRYYRKKLHTVIAGLSPQKIRGRFSGPVILSNSIPKAGTHLIENVLERLPLMRNAGIKTISLRQGTLLTPVINKIQAMKRGAFYNAHLPGNEEILSAVKEAGIKVIFLIRDPRDIAVSRYKYITHIDKLHPAHQQMRAASDDAARLSISILGIKGVMPSIRQAMEDFKPWLTPGASEVFRFEELIGSAGGGSDLSQRAALQRIAAFLACDLSTTQLDSLQEQAFSRKSSTFRKGRVGGWRQEFSEEHLKLLEGKTGQLLSAYGYEP